MWRKILFILLTVTFAFGILLVSVFRTASFHYNFSLPENTSDLQAIKGKGETIIDYELAYPGRVLPDSPLWPAKALRDKLWLLLTTNKKRRSELMLLFADKRLSSAKVLFEKGEYELGFTTLTKAEKYLEEAVVQQGVARRSGADTSDLVERLVVAALKHYEVIDTELIEIAPESAKQSLVQTQKYAKSAYLKARTAMFEEGLTPPETPFDWE